MVSQFIAEKIVNGWILSYWRSCDKFVEYLPSDELLVNRIKEIFTAEKENVELKAVKF